MILRELILHNVGVFLGRQRIPLDTEAGRPVVLIGGLNGRGKTTVLDALQLALFGRRCSAARLSGQSYEEYLQSLIHHDAMPNEAAVSLEFTLAEDGVDRTYRVERVWVRKGSTAKETLTVWIDDSPDPVAAERWADIAEGLLPVEIAELFFFDGEKLEQLADPSTAAKVIEAAVHGLLGVGLVERLERDLGALQRRWRVTDADQAAQEKVAHLNNELAQLQEQCEIAAQEVAALTNKVDQAQLVVTQVRHEFTRNGGDLAAQRTALEDEVASHRQNSSRIRTELADVAAGALPFALVPSLFQRAEKQATLEQQSTATRFALDMLEARDQEVVTVLRDEGLDSGKTDRIAERLRTDRARRANESQVPPHIGLALEGPSRFSSAAVSITASAVAARRAIGELEAVEADISSIERRLESVPPDAVVARLAARVQEAEDAANLAQARVTVADEALQEHRRRLADVESQLARTLEKFASEIIASEDRLRMQKHAERVHSTLTTFRQKMVERQLGVIEVSVLRSFQQLLGKQGMVSQLTISPDDFTVTVHGTGGEVLPPERLSAGERQLLATALLWGLARASGRRLPMVIDTPLGRLDSGHRRNLVERYFPVASGQMILLSTDEEIDKPLQTTLQPFISRTYLLRYDDTRRATSVEEGYFWEASDVA